MKSNNTIINQVLILAIVMAIGFYARKKNIIDEKVSKGLSNLLMEITLPMLIISSFNYKYSKDMLYGSIKIFCYSIVIHLILIALSKLLLHKHEIDEQKVLRAVMIFSNCGFMGYPVVESLYGSVGVFYTAIFNVAFNLFIFGYGTMLFSGKKDKNTIKFAVTNHGSVAVYIGLFIFIFSIQIPSPIYKAINMVGSMTTPISMIIVGSMIANQNILEILKEKKIYYISLLRLIIAPIITILFLKLINAENLLTSICVMIEAMPGAVMVVVFAEKFNGDVNTASKSIFITTILSIITIPLIYMCLQLV